MPLTETSFATATINLNEVERNLDAGITQPYVETFFYGGSSGRMLPDGSPDPLYAYKTKLDPATAILIGKELQEMGERLAASAEVEVAMSMAEVEGLHPQHHPV